MASKKPRSYVEWRVEGDYFSGCNCHFACPCLFVEDPNEGDCEQAYAWHVEAGRYGTTKLDGFNVVAAFYAPGNLVTGPRWTAALYLDERASPQQAEALRLIFSGRVGGHPGNLAAFVGEWLGSRAVPIQFEKRDKHREIHIPDILALEVDGLAGADPNSDSCLTNTALTVTPGFDSVLARSTRYTYQDYAWRWDNSGRFGNFSHFVYTSK
jgi:hypothetical protein